MTLVTILLVVSLIPVVIGVGLLFAARGDRTDRRMTWGLALTGSGAAGFGCTLIAILTINMSSALEDAGGVGETQRVLAEIRADAAEGRAHASEAARQEAIHGPPPVDQPDLDSKDSGDSVADETTDAPEDDS